MVQVGGQQHGEKYLSLQKIDPDIRFILDFFFEDQVVSAQL